jgi:hypothetical protein
VLWRWRRRRAFLRDLLGQRETDPLIRDHYAGGVRRHLVLGTRVVPTAFLGPQIGNLDTKLPSVERLQESVHDP